MRKPGSLRIGLLIFFFLSIKTSLSLSHSGVVPASAELRSFDAAVAETRVEMRQYCSLVQQLMNEKKEDVVVQQSALRHIRKAQELWQSVQDQFQHTPPPEYARDVKFPGRLADIADAMKDMEIHLAAGNARKSFRMCGFGCGLFVALHEENGLVYAVDRLFHLRKTVKTAKAALQDDAELTTDVTAEIVHQRDRVLLAPCPSPGDPEHCEKYRQTVKTLSGTLDDMALAAANGDRKTVADVLDTVLTGINRAYGLSIY